MADKKSQRSGSAAAKVSDVEPVREKSLTIELPPPESSEWRKVKASKLVAGLFLALTVLTGLVAVALIAVSTMSAIAAGALDTGHSGRVVALVVLAVTAAVAIAVSVYGQIAVCTDKNRPIFVAAVVLVVLVVIQAIIAGAAVKVSDKDQLHIVESLSESFQLAKQHSPKHVKTWASMQHSLTCCGMYSPFDYRGSNSALYMPPDVPISCCPSYDPNRSDLVQEREREVCKARNEYYETGCNSHVVEVIGETSSWAFSVAVLLIVLELLSVIAGATVLRLRKQHRLEEPDKPKP